LNAFATATQNLLADQGFHDVVVGKLPVLESEQFEEFSLPMVEPYREKIQNQITKVRSAVVTVFAHEGHGSGFFISKDGYLLTNEHVVRDAKLVTVKLITGRELTAEVLRTNETRDIALLRVEQSGMVPLPLRTKALNVSDEVYSLGSPLKEELDVTLSKGVVSSFRTEDGLKFIQSDANILPGNSGGPLVDENGNVAGIAVRSYMWHGTTGLNFFIPIDEVLNSLGIELTE
jgi:serine protease Do